MILVAADFDQWTGRRNGTFRDDSNHLAHTRRKVPFPKHYCRSSPTVPRRISDSISVVRENSKWIYFCGVQPVFQHAESDRRGFQMFTAQLIYQGACRQTDIVRAFGVSKNSVIRNVNKYRTGGVAAFYTPRAPRGASVITPEVAAQAQQLLGSWSEPTGRRQGTGPQARHAPQGDSARTTDPAMSPPAEGANSRKSFRCTATGRHRQIHAGHP